MEQCGWFAGCTEESVVNMEHYGPLCQEHKDEIEGNMKEVPGDWGKHHDGCTCYTCDDPLGATRDAQAFRYDPN